MKNGDITFIEPNDDDTFLHLEEYITDNSNNEYYSDDNDGSNSDDYSFPALNINNDDLL